VAEKVKPLAAVTRYHPGVHRQKGLELGRKIKIRIDIL